MDDRELLELAAKAAGIKLHVWGTKGAENFADMDGPRGQRWNPLTDDGDALRLAVKLKLHVRHGYTKAIISHQHGVIGEVVELLNGDSTAPFCRAITRAAAEIGKAMKE